MKFQSCRWRHFDFRANVKVLARRGRRASDGGRRTPDGGRHDELAMTITRVFSENAELKTGIVNNGALNRTSNTGFMALGTGNVTFGTVIMTSGKGIMTSVMGTMTSSGIMIKGMDTWTPGLSI
ncbi:hypothetical protein DPMN_137334 [Dreissena polymorpha]|uniref:Uncharacterized protein n=1 Tax=Dreissena polymorpha TaxID=45954 RepID=A0A9D4JIQ5_DREPO|nr:hypothetical protein DPMN_137334 [Dreissena polymorpha]